MPLHVLLPILSAFFLFTSFASASHQIRPKKVLVLASYKTASPVGFQWANGLRSVFATTSFHIDMDIEPLNLIEFHDDRYNRMLVDVCRHKYQETKPDLIITIYNSALGFVSKYGPELFPEIPVIFGGVERLFLETRSLGPDFTGLLTANTYKNTLDLALKIHPGTLHVAIVAGAGMIGRTWSANARKAFLSYEDRIDFIDLSALPMQMILEKTANLPAQTVVLYFPLLEDGAGKKFTGPQAVSQISETCVAPVYSCWTVFLGHGIVGGCLSSQEEEGKELGKLALRILSGEKSRDIPPIEEVNFQHMFDWRQLKRWSIPEDRLPGDSIVKFKELNIWDRYKDRILGAVALIVFQGLLISYLLYQRRVRWQAEKRVRQTKQEYKTVADYTFDWEYWENPDGTLQYVSPACERISGYSVRDFLDNPSLILDIIKLEDRAIWDDHKHHRHSRKESKSKEIEFRIQRLDGEIRWIGHVCQPVLDSQGNEQGFRGSNRDITLRKESELEIIGLKKRLAAESAYLQEEIKLEHNFERIIGQSDSLKYVLHRTEKVASTDSPVLILGETGTGKELIARAIHSLSSRSKRALVKVNCAALPGGLMENELFGREKGAYTGATSRQVGRFEFATGSTLFLDEIGEIPLELQSKLLRVLESGEFERLGDPETRRSDARIVASTNRNLEEEVRQGRFREDLFYRLKVFTITLPPLRKRQEDIPLLVKWYMDQLSRKMGKPTPEISRQTMQSLEDYQWPGNVRELQHVIESAMITMSGTKLEFELAKESYMAVHGFKSYEEMERDYILQVLKAKNWDIGGKDGAASTLKIPPSTLRSRMKKLDLKRPPKS